MPATSTALLALLGLGGGLLLLSDKDKKKGAVPAGPPGTPEGQYTEDAIAALTEYKETPQGKARYFRDAFIPSLLIQLDRYSAEVTEKTDLGGGQFRITYKLVTPKPGVPSAKAVALAAVQNFGWTVFATLNLWKPDLQGLYMMTAPPNLRAEYATHGKPWAIVLDAAAQPSVPPMPGTPPPGGMPPVPGTTPPGTAPPAPPGGQPPGTTPAPPGGFTVPGTNITIPVPPGIIPGTQPPGTQPPGTQPPGTQPPGTQPPGTAPPTDEQAKCMADIDQHMPATTKQLTCAFLHNPATTADALALAALSFKAQGYPIAAQMAEAQAAKRGGGTPGVTPPGTQPPEQLTAYPFKIRSGDIPYMLASYYTGNGARVKEILAVNPGMKAVTKTVNGKKTTFYQPWNVGDTINLPLSWDVPKKPLPKPGTTQPSGEPYTGVPYTVL